MKTPVYVRELREEERERLKTGLRSQDRFEIRRSQIVLASARKETARRIARTLGCDDQTVRNVIQTQKQSPVMAWLFIGTNRVMSNTKKCGCVLWKAILAVI
jgi:hypothetical protein